MKATIKGTSLMMHNGRLADPLDPFAKALKVESKRRGKSDADHEAVAEAEFRGGLYHDEELGPYIPAEWIHAALIEGAKLSKLGKLFKSSVVVNGAKFPLKYKGPRDVDSLAKNVKFRDRRCVRVGQSKVMRTRPVFHDWSVSFEVLIVGEALNVDDVKVALRNAGAMVGMGDGRPMFAGKFEVVSFE